VRHQPNGVPQVLSPDDRTALVDCVPRAG